MVLFLDDDAFILSKKRATHGPILRTESNNPHLSPEKNRFRIYFASPVQIADGPSLKEVAEKDESEDDHELDADGDDEDATGETEGQGGDRDEEDEVEEEFYEAEAETENGDHRDDDQVDEHEDGAEGEVKVEESARDGAVEVEEISQNEASAESKDEEDGNVDKVLIPTDNESTIQDITTTAISSTEPDASINEDDQNKAILDEPTPLNPAPSEGSPMKIEKSPTKSTLALSPMKSQKPTLEPTKLVPREPSSLRYADARFRRSPSLPVTSSDTPRPDSNRLSILYANGKRRICFNSAIIESVKIHRKKGSIRVTLDTAAVRRKYEEDQEVDGIVKRIIETEVSDKVEPEVKVEIEEKVDGDKSVEETIKVEEKAVESVSTPVVENWSFTRGILVEALDENHNVFGPLNTESLAQIWTEVDPTTELESPPFHRLLSTTLADTEHVAGTLEAPTSRLEFTVFLDKEKPLTEPKWVKTGHVEDWIRASRPISARDPDEPDDIFWRSKLQIIDPDAPPTLSSVLDGWALVSKIGSLKDRRRFANGHLSSLNNMVQILLRAVRGTEEPLTRSSLQHSHGPLRSAISPKDFYYNKQSHSSLAVMAIVNLVKDYSYESKEPRNIMEEKIGNIIKSMPNTVIFAATDSLFVDWTNQEPRA